MEYNPQIILRMSEVLLLDTGELNIMTSLWAYELELMRYGI